jgi:hypothetical protein
MFYRLWEWAKQNPNRAMRVGAFFLFFGALAHQFVAIIAFAMVRPSIKTHTLAESKAIFARRDLMAQIVGYVDLTCIAAAASLIACAAIRKRRGLP